MARLKKCNLKRLSMFIPEDIHEYLVKTAVKRNDTITRIVLLAILKYVDWEKKYD